MCVYCFLSPHLHVVFIIIPRAQNSPALTMHLHKSSGRCKVSTKNEYSESQQFPKSVERVHIKKQNKIYLLFYWWTLR